jgi:streptomycin 6-kinase
VTYEHLETWRVDPRWAGWLDALPALLTACVDGWGLEVGAPFTNSHASLTMPAIGRDGAPVILKLQPPDRESRFEAAALQRWDGDGAVRLLDHDEEHRALLLERCEPGLPLSTLEPDAALDVVIGLLPRLWVPAGEPFRPLSEEAGELGEEMSADWDRTGRTVEARVIEAATEAFQELAATQGEQMLVNQDLHADNVLSSRREPWLVIDPKPLAGEREFGVVALVRGGELGHSREAVLGRLDRVSAELGLDRERVRLWTMAHTISWAFGDEGPAPEHVETATWLLDAG